MISYETRVEMDYKEFLPEVYNAWSVIHELTNITGQFREIFNLYRNERSEIKQKEYFNALKTLDENIYKTSFEVHQHIQSIEKIVQPMLNEFRLRTLNEQESTLYIPAYIRIAQNHLNSLKLSFKSIIIKHNSNSIEYQNDLKQSLQLSRTTIAKIKTTINQDEQNLNTTSTASHEQIDLHNEQEQQQVLTKQEIEIADLEIRLESIRILNERIRKMNEMSMALYLSVQEQNDQTDNIWLNTRTGSDYIAQSVNEFRLVKVLKQSKMTLWIKLLCLTFCFLLILLFVLTLILILSQK